jgi:hypothetical protein
MRLIFLGLSVLSIWTTLFFAWSYAIMPSTQLTIYGNTTDTYVYTNETQSLHQDTCSKGRVYINNDSCSDANGTYSEMLSETNIPIVLSITRTFSNSTVNSEPFGGNVILNFFSAYQWVIYTIFAILLIVVFSNTILPLLHRKGQEEM